MRKTILITLSVVLVLVGGIWVYLMLYGAPESTDDIFANFGFPSTPAPTFEPTTEAPVVDTEEPEVTAVDTAQPLNQLTTRPTVGAVILGTTTQSVRYAERGTGHLFEIDLTNNSETRLPGDTFTQVTDATWSPNGQYVVLHSGNPLQKTITLYDLGASSTIFEAHPLPPDANEIAFSEDSETLYFTRADIEGSIAYKYDVATSERTIWFSVPFISVGIYWGEEPVIYNLPGENYFGYTYNVVDGNLERIGFGGLELVATAVPGGVLISKWFGNNYATNYIDNGSGIGDRFFEVPALPEKCAIGEKMWCAFPAQANNSYPIEWYKGRLISDDSLWLFDTELGVASIEASFTALSGRNIDVIDMTADTLGTKLLFRDKTSGTLWLFDTLLN